MPSLITNPRVGSKSITKSLCTSSAASVLLAFTAMAVAPAAHAQVVIDVTSCGVLESGTFDNPGTADAGATVNIDVEGTCTLASGDIIDLEDGNQDDVIINIASGTTLTSTDADDEDTVIFIDNAENNTVINIEAGATLNGANGVIFIEGDGTQIENYGSIIGTGAAEEGVLYVDRDTDSDLINIFNGSTGQIIANSDGPAIGIEVLIADSFDDPEHVGVQDNLSDFPTVRIFNEEGGVIASNGTATNDDNDAINIAGAPGTTNNLDRACIESGALNCIINLRITNEGTISSVADSSSNAGITIEDDAILVGGIVNRREGIITGTRNGIRIGDVYVDGQTAEHSGGNTSSARINNLGIISGTGASSRGIDLEGDGVKITNRGPGVISGVSVGIEVGAGTSSGIEHSGVNNSIRNSGIISGGNFSVDSDSAEGMLRIVSQGGSFDGDIRGSLGNTDILAISGGVTTLTHDVLQNYQVNVGQTGSLTFDGSRTIEGNLRSYGVTTFDLADTQTITGDVNLFFNATVAITDVSEVAAIGQQFTLIDVGGTLTNDGTIDDSAITDGSFLLDFQFVASNDLVVEATAAAVSKGSNKVAGYLDQIQFENATVESFGGTVLNAFVDGALNNTASFSNLGSIGTAGVLGDALNSLAPNFSGSLVQNVSNTIQGSAAQIDHRLNDLECNAFYDGRTTTSVASDGAETCQTFAVSGAWAQSSRPNASQGSLSLSAPKYYNNGSGLDNITMTYGYDQLVGDSTIVGFSGSYTESETEDDSFAVSSTELDILQFSAYAGHRIGNAHLVTKASYSHGEADTRRQSFDVIKSQVDIDGLNVQSLASYNVNMGQGYYLQPEASLNYNDISTGSYSEFGGLNLDVSEANSNVLDGRVGLTLGARKIISDTSRANVYVTGALRNDIYGNREDIGFNFSGQSGSLAVANVDEFAVQALAGFNVVSGKTFSFGGAVNSEFSETENSVGGSVQTKIRW